MVCEERNFITKDGRKAVLRSPEVSDAESFAVYMVKRAKETKYMLRDPDECGSPEEAAALIRRINASPEDVLLLCELEGRIVGSCEMLRKTFRKTAHRAELSLGNLEDYWGLGIGTAMVQALIQIAGQRGITQLELNVFEGNERAMKLYEKFGFAVVAVRPNCIHLQDGSRLKAYTMFLSLE